MNKDTSEMDRKKSGGTLNPHVSAHWPVIQADSQWKFEHKDTTGESGLAAFDYALLRLIPSLFVILHFGIYLQNMIITRWRCDDHIWRNLDGFPLDYPTSGVLSKRGSIKDVYLYLLIVASL